MKPRLIISREGHKTESRCGYRVPPLIALIMNVISVTKEVGNFITKIAVVRFPAEKITINII